MSPTLRKTSPLKGRATGRNVGAPTLKVLLEGLWKEFVFSGIGDSIEASFQNGNRAAWLTSQKRELRSRTPNVGAPTLRVILEVMRAPRVWGLRRWLARDRLRRLGRRGCGLAA